MFTRERIAVGHYRNEYVCAECNKLVSKFDVRICNHCGHATTEKRICRGIYRETSSLGDRIFVGTERSWIRRGRIRTEFK
jgi:DNA-directed RNA polymerase subunit RPC12/RpoP